MFRLSVQEVIERTWIFQVGSNRGVNINITTVRRSEELNLLKSTQAVIKEALIHLGSGVLINQILEKEKGYPPPSKP